MGVVRRAFPVVPGQVLGAKYTRKHNLNDNYRYACCKEHTITHTRFKSGDLDHQSSS